MTPDREGFINILKPPGMTSHDVVGYLRRLLSLKRIGHTGTLDPQAAGVLPVCLGRATRLSAWASEQRKGYRAELTLGWNTDTEDAWGTPQECLPAGTVQERATEEQIRRVLTEFVGPIWQKPPMVSAVRHRGRKLYEWAREGVVVERPSREVYIYSLELLASQIDSQGYPTMLLEATCSKGTYIRTLCADIGQRLRVGGHLSYLLRTFSGPFTLKDAVTLEETLAAENDKKIGTLLKPLDFVLGDLPRMDLDQDHTELFFQGQPAGDSEDGFDEETWIRIYAPHGQFIGLGQNRDGQIWPRRVFHKE